MEDREHEPSLSRPLSPTTAPEGGDAIILVQEPEINACEEFVMHRLMEQTCPDYREEGPMFSIPRVPNRLRRGENDSYEPEIISIGPYHRGNPRLQAMEKKKSQHLRDILSQNPASYLKDFIRNLKVLEDRVRRCYSNDIRLTSNEFVEMMLLDGCFLVHLLLQAAENVKNKVEIDMVWIGPLILNDLLLLENQLPFFVVECVFDNTDTGEYSSSLAELTFDFYCLVTHRKISKYKDMFLPSAEPAHHLLQLYHWFNILPLILTSPPQKPKSNWINFIHSFHVLKRPKKEQSSLDSSTITEEQEKSGIMIPNATVLHEVGIKFKRKNGDSILDVQFSDGVLEVPSLFIHDATVSQFQNLIALEQCYDYYLYNLPQFTAYFKFMDQMINSISDVALLQKKGIIEHAYGSEKEVLRLFNQLTSGATINPNNYLSGLCKEVNKYCKRKRHIWWEIFPRRHCSHPWTIVFLIGALILLVLAFLQTYFSVYSYFRPPS
ncbi:hypothetical protein AAC387_Pa04g2465 [Persea americana]